MNIDTIPNSPWIFKVIVAGVIVMAFALAQFTKRGKKCRTLKGEWVKSKAEKKIADFLYTHNINYKYEPTRIGLRPDFYLPAQGVYIEYWGLADSSESYRKRMYSKMARYKKHGVNILSLYPPDLNNLGTILSRKLNAGGYYG